MTDSEKSSSAESFEATRSQADAGMPSAAWKRPAERWQEAIERYVAYRQLNTWRSKALENDGTTPSSAYDTPKKAANLKRALLRAINFVASRRGVLASNCDIRVEDLVIVADECARVVRRKLLGEKRLGYLQSAYLFNRDSYTCRYCRRTVWDVYAEDTGSESRRVIRLEKDHRVSRQRMDNPDEFDPGNLVTACRSCNAIKGALNEERFRLELESLATAALQKAKP